jgi:hypothetical protein
MTPELAKTYASFRPSCKTDTRWGTATVSVYANKPSAFTFLMQASFFGPLVSQITCESAEPDLTEDDLGLLRFAADKLQKEMQDAVVRTRPGPPSNIRWMRSLRSAAQRQSCLLDNRRGA